jgi:hypothetical protein
VVVGERPVFDDPDCDGRRHRKPSNWTLKRTRSHEHQRPKRKEHGLHEPGSHRAKQEGDGRQAKSGVEMSASSRGEPRRLLFSVVDADGRIRGHLRLRHVVYERA